MGALGRESPLDGPSCRSTGSSTSRSCRTISADCHGGEFYSVQFFFVVFLSAPPPAVPEPEAEMTDPAADRKRDHSAVDQSSSAADEDARGRDGYRGQSSATPG